MHRNYDIMFKKLINDLIKHSATIQVEEVGKSICSDLLISMKDSFIIYCLQLLYSVWKASALVH